LNTPGFSAWRMVGSLVRIASGIGTGDRARSARRPPWPASRTAPIDQLRLGRDRVARRADIIWASRRWIRAFESTFDSGAGLPSSLRGFRRGLGLFFPLFLDDLGGGLLLLRLDVTELDLEEAVIIDFDEAAGARHHLRRVAAQFDRALQSLIGEIGLLLGAGQFGKAVAGIIAGRDFVLRIEDRVEFGERLTSSGVGAASTFSRV
jgi:hypothetical protein